MKALAARFVEESSLELHSFLCTPLADKLERGLREVDAADGLDASRRNGRIPPHNIGTSSGTWTIKSPPHKWRYCVLKPHVYGPSEEFAAPVPQPCSDELIRSLQDELFQSNAFRAWLSVVSRLLPMRYTVEGRRFRPGLDYTLATSEEKETRLDVVLGLTPDVANTLQDESEMNGEDESRGWQGGEWGGWEVSLSDIFERIRPDAVVRQCYMAPHDEEDDPAVYRSGSHKKQPPNGNQNGNTSTDESEPDIDGEDVENEADDEDDDSTLLTVQPGYNRLLLVLRDEGVMRFVKYVSAAAPSSRWDVCGEYEIGMVQDDE
jgi:prolyl 3-hydroxylase /prolyl 3,4-dihydroxylase